MNLIDYINPPEEIPLAEQDRELGQCINSLRCSPASVPLKKGDVAIIGLPSLIKEELVFNGSHNQIRKELYSLSVPDPFKCNLYDIGDLKLGRNIRESLYVLHVLLSMLREADVFVLLIGGSNVFNLGVLKSFESLEGKGPHTLSFVEPHLYLNYYKEFDMIDFSKLNCYYLGVQSYYLTQSQKSWSDKFQHEIIRLGKIRGNLEEAEPFLRNSDGCSISVNVIRHSDAPGQENAYPNGLYGEEACQLARYTGLANQLSVFCVFDYFPEHDRNQLTAKLLAQILWFTIEGYQMRRTEHPYFDSHFRKFLVSLDNHNITFYKSEHTSRWWMEIPVKGKPENQVFPCNQSDYDTACRQELPERWFHIYRKLNFTNDNS